MRFHANLASSISSIIRYKLFSNANYSTQVDRKKTINKPTPCNKVNGLTGYGGSLKNLRTPLNLRLFPPLKYPNEYLELCYKKENNFFIVIH
jgi:hypothetical protein